MRRLAVILGVLLVFLVSSEVAMMLGERYATAEYLSRKYSASVEGEHDIPEWFPVLLVTHDRTGYSAEIRPYMLAVSPFVVLPASTSYTAPIDRVADLNRQLAAKGAGTIEVRQLADGRQDIRVERVLQRSTNHEIGCYIASPKAITPKSYARYNENIELAHCDWRSLRVNLIIWAVLTAMYAIATIRSRRRRNRCSVQPEY